jgi:hypothetical protein
MISSIFMILFDVLLKAKQSHNELFVIGCFVGGLYLVENGACVL